LLLSYKPHHHFLTALFLPGLYVSLPATTVRNLELFRNTSDNTPNGTLLWLLDKTVTQFGARMLRKWISRPLKSVE
jgi:DNA mismatch repair protein MSH3